MDEDHPCAFKKLNSDKNQYPHLSILYRLVYLTFFCEYKT